MNTGKQLLQQQFQTTTHQLMELIGSFDESSFNRKPDDGGWNAGQVAEHLLLFDKRLVEILATAVHATDRAIDEKTPTYTQRVTDRINKLEAPTFLVPSDEHRSPAEMIQKMSETRKNLQTKFTAIDLSLHSTEFPHRFFGEMTAYEWINFVDLHAHRHIPQLQSLQGL